MMAFVCFVVFLFTQEPVWLLAALVAWVIFRD